MKATKNFKEYHNCVHFPVFQYDIFITYTNNIRQSRNLISSKIGRYDVENNVAALHAYHDKDPVGHIFFTPKTSIGVIVHEVSHSLWQMFRYYGAELENETFAYHLGYVVDIVMKFKNVIDKKHKNFRNDQKAV